MQRSSPRTRGYVLPRGILPLATERSVVLLLLTGPSYVSVMQGREERQFRLVAFRGGGLIFPPSRRHAGYLVPGVVGRQGRARVARRLPSGVLRGPELALLARVADQVLRSRGQARHRNPDPGSPHNLLPS